MRVPVHPSGRRRRRDDGFGLVEIIVSLGVFAVLASAGAAVMIDALHTSRDNRERVRAANLADQEIERSRATFRVSSAGVLDRSFSEVSAEGHTYQVKRDVTWMNQSGSPVGDGTTPRAAVLGDTLLVEVKVVWSGLGERPAVINTTVLS